MGMANGIMLDVLINKVTKTSAVITADSKNGRQRKPAASH